MTTSSASYKPSEVQFFLNLPLGHDTQAKAHHTIQGQMGVCPIPFQLIN